jgi:hypothetical protein
MKMTEKSLLPKIQEELNTLRAKVAHRREYLKLLQFELFNTRAALQEFTNIYAARLGPLEAEYSRLEALMDEAIAFEEAAPSVGENGQPHKQNGQPGHGASAKAPPRKGKKTTPEYEQKMRELFRNLAKRFHPDLVNDPKEKSRRQSIMARINAAYTARDLLALESLARHTENTTNGSGSDPNAELAHLRMELTDLEGMIFEVEHTIREIDLSPAMQLRSEYESDRNAGRDFFVELERELHERTAEIREYLLELDISPELIWK